MHGYNVFFPIGFDAFGLPAENAAIKSGGHPFTWTMQNIENMRRQFRTMGATFAWKHEVVTADPSYYRWNQWMFLRFLEKGLAYRKMSPVDWCPNDGTLAREQVEGADRHCWRCGALVEKRDLEQWYLRTTAYADELLDFTRHRLAGADPHPADELDRPLRGRRDRLRDRAVRPPPGRRDAARLHDAARTRCSGPPSWSSRRSTRWSRTLTAPEQRAEVEAYVEQARRRTEIDRLSTDREKTGVAIGADAINPINGERIPIFIADYVLSGYGTGAIMAVPAHDERDFAFAQQFGLPIRRVVAAPGTAADDPMADAYVAHADGERLVNSGAVRRDAGRRGRQGDRREAGGGGQGRAQGHLPTARLADQPPALLGHADPDHLLRDGWHRARCPTRTCRSACRRTSTTRAAATTR